MIPDHLPNIGYYHIIIRLLTQIFMPPFFNLFCMFWWNNDVDTCVEVWLSLYDFEDILHLFILFFLWCHYLSLILCNEFCALVVCALVWLFDAPFCSLHVLLVNTDPTFWIVRSMFFRSLSIFIAYTIKKSTAYTIHYP